MTAAENCRRRKVDINELISLNKAPPPRGRRPKEPNCVVERDLERADIDALWDLKDGGLQSSTPPLQKLRQRHHALARLLAAGTKEAEASLITGYQLSSISILRQDPAFKELLAYYQQQKEEIFIDFFERLKTLSIHTVDELLDRLDAAPEDFSIDDLQKILTLAADRTGYGPSKSLGITGTIGVVTSEHLLRIKEEVLKRQNGQIQRLDAKDQRAEVGRPLIEKSLAEEAQVLEPPEEGSGL
jgi:hypothetical protein